MSTAIATTPIIVHATSQDFPRKSFDVLRFGLGNMVIQNFRFSVQELFGKSQIIEEFIALPSNLKFNVVGDVLTITGNGAYTPWPGTTKHGSGNFTCILNRSAMSYEWKPPGYPPETGTLDPSSMLSF